MNINKDTLRRKLDLALSQEIKMDTEIGYIPIIGDDYQKLLDRIVNIIMSS